jgi:OOP family OmpA-OmpF porin
MKQCANLLSLVLVMAWGITSIAGAQDASELTAEELEALFKKQTTRGLVISPPADVTENAPEAPETEVAEALEYIQLAPDEQVNIKISFDFDSSALGESEKKKLTTLCQVLNAVDVQLFRIVGHTDSSGSADYNQRLSLLRAEEVKRYLVEDCGVAAQRLEAVGVGEAFPFDPTEPTSDDNRRVEFQALS